MILDSKVLKKVEERWVDEVVKLAKSAIEQSGVYDRKAGLQRAQLSNLQNLAGATDSVEAIKLFVLYQMGRNEGKGWRYGKDESSRFGDLVIQHIEKLGEYAEEIDHEKKKQIHLWLIRLYTGFLIRWFVALREIPEESLARRG